MVLSKTIRGQSLPLLTLLEALIGHPLKRTFLQTKDSRTIFVGGARDVFINNTQFHQNEEGVLAAVGNDGLSIHIENSCFSNNSVVVGFTFQITLIQAFLICIDQYRSDREHR